MQKNRGPTENILHLFSRFSGFSRFFPSQPIAFQAQAAAKTLQNKSYLKSYRRFFVRSGMCHNRRVNVEMTGRNQGSAGWTAVKGRPALRAKRFGTRYDSSALGQPAGKRHWRACVRNCNSAHPGSGWYKPVQVSTSEYNQKKFEHLQCKPTCHSR